MLTTSGELLERQQSSVTYAYVPRRDIGRILFENRDIRVHANILS